jgi:hypothetical protein
MAVHVANALEHETRPDPGGVNPNRLDPDYLEEFGGTNRLAGWRGACREWQAAPV